MGTDACPPVPGGGVRTSAGATRLQGALDYAPVHNYSVVMEDLRFEWDPSKDRANQRKHGVSFEEAQSVFHDHQALQFWDEGHAQSEDRFLLLGLSARLRILMVCHCVREAGNVIRIISARKATAKERRHYPWGRR